MNSSMDSGEKQQLFSELISPFLGDSSAAGQCSHGVVGPGAAGTELPLLCLRTCLGGDPQSLSENGCEWIKCATRGRLDSKLVPEGTCPRGHRVSARSINLEGGRAFLVTIEAAADRPPHHTAPLAHEAALEHLEAAANLVDRMSRLQSENVGLADEVLRGYEQLNLIFEFTRNIATVTDAESIEWRLLRQIAGVLKADSIHVVTPSGQTRRFGDESDDAIDRNVQLKIIAPLYPDIRAVRESGSVAVTKTADAGVLLAPLQHFDGRIDVVVAVRLSGASGFSAGDVMLAESILTFGAQILSNNELHEQLRRIAMESTRALVAAIDKKDHYTSGHSERVGFLARLTGERLGLSVAELHVLEMAGLLHDVGKIGIPEHILRKAGRLTSEEFETIKMHPTMGYEILKPIASFTDVLDGVRLHHENHDGSGYPDGLAGYGVPLFARIIHVVDVFDALNSTRSYRKSFSIDEALAILREESGTKLDPDIVREFESVVAELRGSTPQWFSTGVDDELAASAEQSPAEVGVSNASN